MPFAIRLPFENKIAEPREERRIRNGKDPVEGKVTQEWALALTSMVDTTQASATRVGVATLINQFASIAATPLPIGSLPAGIYRLSFYTQVTQAATTSSSLQVTLDWTINGIAQSETSVALTTNAVTSHQDADHLIVVDENTPVRYATTYASVGGTVMVYNLYVTLERVAA